MKRQSETWSVTSIVLHVFLKHCILLTAFCSKFQKAPWHFCCLESACLHSWKTTNVVPTNLFAEHVSTLFGVDYKLQWLRMISCILQCIRGCVYGQKTPNLKHDKCCKLAWMSTLVKVESYSSTSEITCCVRSPPAKVAQSEASDVVEQTILQFTPCEQGTVKFVSLLCRAVVFLFIPTIAASLPEVWYNVLAAATFSYYFVL